MACAYPRRAKTRDRPQRHCDDPNRGEIGAADVEAAGLAADAAREVGVAALFQRSNRTAAAGAFHEAKERQAILQRKAFGGLEFLPDRGVGRAAAQSEVIVRDDHVAPLHAARSRICNWRGRKR